jgi:DNA-binding NtrC family response regulator
MSSNASNKSLFQLLVIDDDQLIADSIKLILPTNWRMTRFANGKHLDGKLTFHAAFIDMHLTEQTDFAEGPQIIKKIATENPKIEIIAMSGDLSMQLMEECLNSGAKKFLAKPLQADEVLSTLEKIEALWMLRRREAHPVANEIQWIGTSKTSENIKKQIADLRGEAGPILIEGQTGTGKEVVAQLLNLQEVNRHMISVNIASIPENLFESEFFGHTKGAFTGADQIKIGLTEAAQGGDLFLDEIEAMPLTQQVKLLRFLETGEIRKVGAKESQIIKTRVIVASNQNLNDLVKEGKFREDLLFRISGKRMKLPSLQERHSDISELAQYFISNHRPRTNKNFSPEALQALTQYSWPGNVRELKRICEQLILTCPLPIIRAQDVSLLLNQMVNQMANPASSQTKVPDLDYNMGLGKLVENFEASVLSEILKKTKDIEKASEILKISKSTLYKKIKDYQIEDKI